MPIETLTDRAHAAARDLPTGDAIPRVLALLVEAVARLTAAVEHVGGPGVPPTVVFVRKPPPEPQGTVTYVDGATMDKMRAARTDGDIILCPDPGDDGGPDA